MEKKGEKTHTEIAKGRVPKIILWDKRKWLEKVHRMCKLSLDERGRLVLAEKVIEWLEKAKFLVLCSFIVDNIDFSLEPKSWLNSVDIIGTCRGYDQGKESEWSGMTKKRK